MKYSEGDVFRYEMAREKRFFIVSGNEQDAGDAVSYYTYVEIRRGIMDDGPAEADIFGQRRSEMSMFEDWIGTQKELSKIPENAPVSLDEVPAYVKKGYEMA